MRGFDGGFIARLGGGNFGSIVDVDRGNRQCGFCQRLGHGGITGSVLSNLRRDLGCHRVVCKLCDFLHGFRINTTILGDLPCRRVSHKGINDMILDHLGDALFGFALNFLDRHKNELVLYHDIYVASLHA